GDGPAHATFPRVESAAPAPLLDASRATRSLFEGEHIDKIGEALLRCPAETFDDLVEIRTARRLNISTICETTRRVLVRLASHRNYRSLDDLTRPLSYCEIAAVRPGLIFANKPLRHTTQYTERK